MKSVIKAHFVLTFFILALTSIPSTQAKNLNASNEKKFLKAIGKSTYLVVFHQQEDSASEALVNLGLQAIDLIKADTSKGWKKHLPIKFSKTPIFPKNKLFKSLNLTDHLPLIVLFTNEIEFFYTGDKTDPQAVVKWLHHKLVSPSNKIATEADWKAVSETNFPSVCYFGPKNKNFKLFLEIARETDNVNFCHSHDEKFLTANNSHSLTIFKDYRGGTMHYDFEEEFSEYELTTFINEHL